VCAKKNVRHAAEHEHTHTRDPRGIRTYPLSQHTYVIITVLHVVAFLDELGLHQHDLCTILLDDAVLPPRFLRGHSKQVQGDVVTHVVNTHQTAAERETDSVGTDSEIAHVVVEHLAVVLGTLALAFLR